MNRLEDPSGGEIHFNGQPLSAYAPALLRRSVVFIHQTPTVLDATVRNNLLLPFRFRANGDLAEPSDRTLRDLLGKVDLMPESLNRNALQLSVGQLQRICLIRGLLLSPEVILLDEPTSALDEESSGVVQAIVEAACLESGITVVMVNHRQFIPHTVTPVSLKLEGGRLVEGP
jgi:putative ABC transport system ATP-binding protein